jgi:hypothetical protein
MAYEGLRAAVPDDSPEARADFEAGVVPITAHE